MSERKTLYTFGRKRKPDYVRVIRETTHEMSRIRVLWKLGRPRVESFDDTRRGITEAKAFAEGKHESLQRREPERPAERSLHAIYEAHVLAKTDEWRPATLRNLTDRWRKFELYAGRSTPAYLVTRETLDGFKRGMLERHAPNQVRLAIKAVTSVFRWAVDRDLIPATKVVTYSAKFSKDVLRTGPKMAEYRSEERDKVLTALDPRSPTEWRAYVLTTLFAYCGPRQNAARQLAWADVDLAAGVLTWRAETDKMGNERRQPMPAPVLEALWIAYGWRIAEEYPGRFVFFGVQRRTRGFALKRNTRRSSKRESLDGVASTEKPYSYAAYMAQLRAAERRAGVTSIKYQGAHAWRRGIAGNVHAMTGSEKAAADWIGDKSVKIVRDHYLLTREEELARTATLVSAPAETAAVKRSETQRDATEGAPVIPQVVDSPQSTEEPAVGIEPTTARSGNVG